MASSIRIAITGSGLAGASLLHALLKFSHLDVDIFESAPAFKEAGMAIGLTRNAQAALDLIGPSAIKCLERAGAVPMRGVRFMVAQGEEQGEVVDEVDDIASGKRLTSIVHRAAFLQELLADVPGERLHASKKLAAVDRAANAVTLHFTDGTTHECDILIGADGIHSTVRKLILGENSPDASPRNTGAWIVMTLQPYSDALAKIGEEFIDVGDPREYSWLGHNSYVLHNLLSNSELVQFVIGSNDKLEPELSNRWRRALLCDLPEQEAIYLWEHPPARTYVAGPLCVMGDAAHATTPWQGSGGGMSIEDSLILSALLGSAKNPTEALTALKVYDQVRRPQTQRIVESSRVTGAILTGSGEATFNLKTSEKLLRRWDFILDIDMRKHYNEAVEMMERELGRSG
ncbi:hypothetical protein DL764_003533 [Monosporascus ibericus]|uniref:FAD-binding domain-containing protein n=1 Tax=Monosporascus ibericus TaxID=155417 RepID=A0A4Q4THW4_9PEZI|nr:hypothetical protein DL764_003533 [Monosporascus ibericus]